MSNRQTDFALVVDTRRPQPLACRVPAIRATFNAGNRQVDFALVVDTREQQPLTFHVPTIRATLHTGDYSIAGFEDQFIIERKSLPDLVSTIIHDRDRFERELARMAPFAFRRVIVIAPYAAVARYRYGFSAANPRAVIASINAFEMRYNVPFIFAANPQEAADRITDWAHYFVREYMKTFGSQETHPAEARKDAPQAQAGAGGTLTPPEPLQGLKQAPSAVLAHEARQALDAETLRAVSCVLLPFTRVTLHEAHLLIHMMRGETLTDISKATGVSVAALHQRWQYCIRNEPAWLALANGTIGSGRGRKRASAQ